MRHGTRCAVSVHCLLFVVAICLTSLGCKKHATIKQWVHSRDHYYVSNFTRDSIIGKQPIYELKEIGREQGRPVYERVTRSFGDSTYLRSSSYDPSDSGSYRQVTGDNTRIDVSIARSLLPLVMGETLSGSFVNTEYADVSIEKAMTRTWRQVVPIAAPPKNEPKTVEIVTGELIADDLVFSAYDRNGFIIAASVQRRNGVTLGRGTSGVSQITGAQLVVGYLSSKYSISTQDDSKFVTIPLGRGQLVGDAWIYVESIRAGSTSPYEAFLTINPTGLPAASAQRDTVSYDEAIKHLEQLPVPDVPSPPRDLLSRGLQQGEVINEPVPTIAVVREVGTWVGRPTRIGVVGAGDRPATYVEIVEISDRGVVVQYVPVLIRSQ